MKGRQKVFRYFGFAILFVMLMGVHGYDVQAISGEITCTYQLPYIDTKKNHREMTLTYHAKDGYVDTDYSCSVDDKDSPCSYLKTHGVGSSELTKFINFYSSGSKEMKCPSISYAMKKDWGSMWDIRIGHSSERLASNHADWDKGSSDVLTGEESNVVHPKNEDVGNGTNSKMCYYKYTYNNGRTVDIGIEFQNDSSETKLLIGGKVVGTTDGGHIYRDGKLACPDASAVHFCMPNPQMGGMEGDYRVTLNRMCPATHGGANVQEAPTQTVDSAGNDITDPWPESTNPDGDSSADLGPTVDASCAGILGDTLELIQQVFDWIKILAPILLIIFGSLDYAKAVIANDDKGLNKATSNFIKRCIAAVAVFFLPFLINFVLSLPGVETGLQDAVCGISKVVIR